MKTLLPRCAVLTWRSRSNANALLPPISFCSATVRGRGSDVIASPGPLGSEQARAASVAGTRVLHARVRVIVFQTSVRGCHCLQKYPVAFEALPVLVALGRHAPVVTR